MHIFMVTTLWSFYMYDNNQGINTQWKSDFSSSNIDAFFSLSCLMILAMTFSTVKTESHELECLWLVLEPREKPIAFLYSVYLLLFTTYDFIVLSCVHSIPHFYNKPFILERHWILCSGFFQVRWLWAFPPFWSHKFHTLICVCSSP